MGLKKSFSCDFQYFVYFAEGEAPYQPDLADQLQLHDDSDSYDEPQSSASLKAVAKAIAAKFSLAKFTSGGWTDDDGYLVMDWGGLQVQLAVYSDDQPLSLSERTQLEKALASHGLQF